MYTMSMHLLKQFYHGEYIYDHGTRIGNGSNEFPYVKLLDYNLGSITSKSPWYEQNPLIKLVSTARIVPLTNTETYKLTVKPQT